VKLVRSGSLFAGYESEDGQSWRLVGKATIFIDATAYVCLAVSSHANGTPCTATFDNVVVLPTGNG
jgi:hypothetical protein